MGLPTTDLAPTPSQTVGPYFHLGCIETGAVSRIAGTNAKGERVRLICQVIDGEGVPVDDAMVEIWQADSEGRYNHPMDENANSADPHGIGFGRLATDTNGFCIFETIKPGRVSADAGKLQAPHLNVFVFARGILKQLVTRIYFADEPANHECPILNLVPQERRATLMARPDIHNAGDWYFAIHLCGKDETVFFDI
jgi:protocatechuate 3,4-dioxygenase, alpha subunit